MGTLETLGNVHSDADTYSSRNLGVVIGRPSNACVTCKPPRTNAWSLAEHGWLICDGCYNRIESALTEINERYFLLDPAPGGGASDGRGAPGFGSRPPANLSALVMRDHRSSQTARVWFGQDGRVHREDEAPGMSAWSTLATWSTEVCELRGFELRDRTVAELCYWLGTQLDWLGRQESIAEFERDVTRLVRQLRPMTGDRRYPIGRCTQEFDDESMCGARLYAPESGDTISCGRCDAEWPRSSWLDLGDELAAS